MSLNKKKMVREIGRRTRIHNRDVQAVIEALIDVWTEELVNGGRIEIEGFLMLSSAAHHVHRLIAKPGTMLKERLTTARDGTNVDNQSVSSRRTSTRVTGSPYFSNRLL